MSSSIQTLPSASFWMPSKPPEPRAARRVALPPSTGSPFASRPTAKTPPLGALDSAVSSSCWLKGSHVMPSIVG
jgi:hypothetical protein